jgi:methyl-accepting chemotaxis protein/ligand-binding sensor domain-containing protein
MNLFSRLFLRLLAVALCQGALISIHAQAGYQFTHLTAEDGLLDDIAYSIMQDSKGYLWIGTMAGLQRYDGYEFINFRYDPRNPAIGLKESVVRHIMEKSDGTIWVGTQGGGISVYEGGRFVLHLQIDPKDQNSLPGNVVEDIIEDKKGGMWIATDQGLTYYLDGKFMHYKHNPSDASSLSHSNVFSVCLDNQGRLWVGTQEGLNLMTAPGAFQRIFHNPADAATLSGNFIHDIIEDRKGNIWLAVVQGGVCRLDPATMRVTRFMHVPGNPNSMGNNIALSLARDPDDNIWAATWGGGLNKISGDRVTNYRFDPNDERSILTDNVEEVMVDKAGNVWTANYLGGINRFSKQEIVSYAYGRYKAEGLLPTGNLRDVKETRDGSIWIATHSGVTRYRNGRFEQFLHDPANPLSTRGLSSTRANYILEDSNGKIWIGNLGAGVDMYENGTFSHILADKRDSRKLHSDEVNVLVEDNQGRIWMGTVQEGVSMYDGRAFTAFRHTPGQSGGLSSDRILDMFAARDGSVWIATGNGGICQYRDGKFIVYKHDPKNPNSLPTNFIRAVAVDNMETVWVGYSGGIARKEKNSDSFKVYTEEQGLAGPVVEKLAIDADGQVWVATHSGASRYLPELDQFESFTKKQGLSDNKLVSAFASRHSRRVFFGGPDGFYHISLDRDKEQTLKPNLQFTDLVLTGDHSDSVRLKLRGDLLAGNRVTLRHFQNSFEVRFAAMSNDIRPSHKYSYRIKNLDDRWTYLGASTKIAFTYLKPGDYQLEVRLHDRGKDDLTQTVNITIMEPWWNTWWFKSIIGLVIIGISVYFFRARKARQKAIRLELEQKVMEATGQVKEQNAELEKERDNLKVTVEETNFVIREAVESGNLSARIDITNKAGEWRALGESINQLFDSILAPFREINRVVNHLAEGDLTQRYSQDAKGDAAVLAENLNLAIENLRGLLNDILQQSVAIEQASKEMLLTSQEMNLSSGEIASSIAEMSSGASQQVTKVDEVSNLIEGIMRASKEMGNQAESINQTATKGVARSDEGLLLISRVDKSMSGIMEYSDQSKISIEGLAQRSAEISKVLRIIRDIASQTNLLALNAAIEAAQAGDAGRGFAVVATEIRQLAESSKNSTREIEQLIHEVQADTEATAKLISEMNLSVVGGEEAAKNASRAFRDIASQYAQTLQLSEKIVEATRQQVDGIGNIVGLTEGVVVIAEETAAGSEQIASSSAELSSGMTNYTSKSKQVLDIIEELRAQVGRFRM